MLVVDGSHELIPSGDDLHARFMLETRGSKHFFLHGDEKSRDLLGYISPANELFVASITTANHNRFILHILRTDFNAETDSMEFMMVELPAGGVVLTSIGDGANTCLLELALDLSDFSKHLLLNFLGGVVAGDGDDDGLSLGDLGREDETLVIRVGHQHDTDRTGGNTPRVLPDKLFALVLGLVFDIEHLTKILAQAVAGGTLDGLAGLRDEGFDSGSVKGTGELLLATLASLDDRDGQEVLIHLAVELEDFEDLGLSLSLRGKGSVALLPQEFTGADEGSGILELPTDNISPLVKTEGKITVTANPLTVVRVHDGFRSGSNGNGLFHGSVTGLSHPCDLRSETLDMVLLGVQDVFGNEKGKIGVFHTTGLDLFVKPALNNLPHGISTGSEDITTRNIIVADQFASNDKLSVPVTEVVTLLSSKTKFGLLLCLLL
mmetsp:Transcript_28833/g.52959  ORF Transcript_28833/g.52959 Transcript_28833/m.52959 type:complete len:435 (-) Transcript_28833:189-1493(-)